MQNTTQTALRETRDELGALEDTSFIPVLLDETISIVPRSIVQSLQSLEGVTLWDKFIWDEDTWDELAVTDGFQLDSGEAGILGENWLGSAIQLPITHYAVKNYNNIWVWDFSFETAFDSEGEITQIGFTDTDNTTATVNTTTRTLTIADGEVWTSEPFHVDPNAIQGYTTFALSQLTVDDDTGLVIEIGITVPNVGIVWEPVTLSTPVVRSIPVYDARVRLSKTSGPTSIVTQINISYF